MNKHPNKITFPFKHETSSGRVKGFPVAAVCSSMRSQLVPLPRYPPTPPTPPQLTVVSSAANKGAQETVRSVAMEKPLLLPQGLPVLPRPSNQV